MYRLNIYKGKRFIESHMVDAIPLPTSEAFPYKVKYNGEWVHAAFDRFGNLSINIGKSVPTPKPAPKPLNIVRAARPVTEKAPAGEQAPQVTYEQWKAGRRGVGPKVQAPRGLGEEWQARLYCENAIARAEYFAYSHHSKKQYRCGSYNARRQSMILNTKKHAWEAGIEIAKAVVAASEGYWTGKKELVKEAFGYSSYLLELAGN